MIFYLLAPALMLGFVESRADNVTEDVLSNQTLTVFTNDISTMKPKNVTFSWHDNEKPDLQDGLRGNHTSAFIPEDDERFQDQEAVVAGTHCLQDALLTYCDIYCGEAFHQEMQSISRDDWCVLEKVIRPYDTLTQCLEEITVIFRCYFPNPGIQDYFLFIHSNYFQNCTEEEEILFEDAPYSLVITLTIISVSFIPILVYLVVSKGPVPAEKQRRGGDVSTINVHYENRNCITLHTSSNE